MNESTNAISNRSSRFFPKNIVKKFSLVGILAIALGAANSAAFAAEQDRVTAAHLMSNLTTASWIQDGNGAKIVYVFFDPNCPYCHKVYDAVLKIRKNSPDLQFRWVPLAMLGGSSQGKAAAIIQAKDPLAAFTLSEQNYGFLNNDTGGGIAPIKNITNATKLLLDENLSIIQGENLAGIPVGVFQATDGKPFYFMGERTQAQLQEILSFVAAGNFGGGTAIKAHK